ncbi:MAG: 50S ribosomal protein L16 [Nanobdellota archaeon]
MAKQIRAVAWRRLERPYTRRSKYRSKAFVRAVPTNKVVKYEMGNLSKEFPVIVRLHSSADIQIRHNALESSRNTANRALTLGIGRANYRFRLRVYPHHILRNNPLAAGAGADRMSTGMKKSFGKPVGVAAQVRSGQPIMEVHCQKRGVESAKNALNKARKKMPKGGYIEIVENKKAVV